MTKYCVPGTRLCLSNDKYFPGNGTFENNGYIYSSLTGVVNFVPKERSYIVEVKTDKGQTTIPVPGDIATVQITVITKRFARCMIKCVGETMLPRPFRGVIKKEDVYATNKDQVEIHKCFRPGDIVLARILPVNELQSYQLSTAENELGVVIALSEAGVAMIPISWTEMQCPKTYNKQKRKVAKVVPESISVD